MKKRFLKRWLSLMLAVILALPGMTANAANSASYGDVQADAWYKEAVDYVTQCGIMTGYTNGNFGPEDLLSRAQFAAILYRVDGSPQTAYKNTFSDVSATDWFAKEAAWAAETGVLTGQETGRFSPDAHISRQDQLAILYSYAAYKNYDTSASDSLSAFQDASEVSENALTAMQWAAAKGLLQDSADALRPKDPITRAETAAIIMRFMEAAASDAPAPDTQTPDSADGSESIIYVDPAAKPEWDEFAVYLWGDGTNGTWPGAQLTEKNGEGYYVYRLPDDLQGKTLTVIFNNNNGGEQIEEQWKIGPGEQKIWRPGDTAVGVWEDYEPQTIVYVASDYLAAYNWEQVAVYIWGDHENSSWPGAAAELQTEGDWAGYWKYELSADDYEGTTDNNVILNIGTGAGGGDNQADAGKIEWGEIKVMTADGRWVDAAQLTATSVSMFPADGAAFYTDTLDVTLRAPNCTEAVYQLGEATPVPFSDGDVLTIGGDLSDGDTVKLTLTGTNAAGGEVTASAAYTKYYNAGVEPVSVLFIGNSYTYYGELWSEFQKIAYSAGYNVDVDNVTEGSYRLYQYADPTDAKGAVVEQKLASNKYDVVFLQEQSVDPITNNERFESGATTLYQRIKQHNEDCRVILYQTWGRKTGSDTLTTAGRGWTNETMTHDIRYAYAKLGGTLGVDVSPVGAAFFDVYSNHADTIELYNEDLQHPSGTGTYLAALVHFQTAFGSKLDQVTYTYGLSSDEAGILKQAAKDAPQKALEPHVYVTPIAGELDEQTFEGDSLTITLHAVNTARNEYQIDDAKAAAYEHGTTVTIGDGLAAGETVTVTVTGYDDGGSVVDTKMIRYTKQAEPLLVVGWYAKTETTGLEESHISLSRQR